MGIEAAHRTELVAEGGLRALNHRRKTAPYRKVSRLQKKTCLLYTSAIWGTAGYTVLLAFALFKTGSLSKSIFNAH